MPSGIDTIQMPTIEHMNAVTAGLLICGSALGGAGAWSGGVSKRFPQTRQTRAATITLSAHSGQVLVRRKLLGRRATAGLWGSADCSVWRWLPSCPAGRTQRRDGRCGNIAPQIVS
jgi:hypothetical protein